MKNKLAKWKPYIFLAVLLASLVPLVWLGRYNYPTGDDYYYGTEAHLVWQQTGSIPQAISAACAGVAKSYQIWQGTYSALFLMYLAPNAFSNTAYHLVTFVILLLLCGSIFYLLRPLVCHFLPGTCGEWITISSVFSFLCIQTVAFQSDSFYWYNGSMYYTGFFAVTLFFLGTLLRYLYNGKKILMLPLLLFAIFLGGGNYVSLLPCMLFVVTVTFLLLLQRNKKTYVCGITSAVLLLSFAVSAMAPGNQVRQDGMWKIPAWKAIAKCLLQGVRYTFAWTGLWWLLAALLLLPVFLRILQKKNGGIFLRIVLLHVLSSVLYHELHRTRPGRSHCLLYVSADQFCCVLLLARIYSPEAANASEYSGENVGPRQVENCPLCRHDGPVGRHPFHRSMAGDLRRKSDPGAGRRGSRCLCCRIRRTTASVE